MNATSADHTASRWRPVPWIAAVLGFFGSGLGLLYVQRPWFAAAYFSVSLGAGLALIYATWALGFDLQPGAFQLVGLAVSIACAVHAHRIACTTTSFVDRKWYSRWYGLAIFPVALVVPIFLFRSFVYEPFRMPSQSMHPTIPQGSLLFVDKSGFGTPWRDTPAATIYRGDVVAHRLVDDPATTYLGRIVGLPGDRIKYTNKRLVINGNAVPIRMRARDERYQYAVELLDGHEVTIALMPERIARDFDGVVPPDHYLVLGDSRDNARDSRYIGFVPRDHVIGRVVKILPPRQR